MRKLIAVCICGVVVYIAAVFLFPEQADTIGSFLGIDSWNEQLRNTKQSLEKTTEDFSVSDGDYSQAIQDARYWLKEQIAGTGTIETTTLHR